MCDLDHEQQPDAVVARRQVLLEIFDAQGQRPRKYLVERVVRLALRAWGPTPTPAPFSLRGAI